MISPDGRLETRWIDYHLPIYFQNSSFIEIGANPTLERQVGKMAEWQKSKIFDYGGRTNVGVPKFTSGECAMLTESSAGYAGLKRNAKFDFGVSMLPYWPDVQGAPQNTIIGGASLWVLKGASAKDYKGVARFFSSILIFSL